MLITWSLCQILSAIIARQVRERIQFLTLLSAVTAPCNASQYRGAMLMPTYVRTDKCDGCRGQHQTACAYVCPHDLMTLDTDGSRTGYEMKAYNQEPEQCWECYACVKVCPRQAVEVRHYADVVPLGASVQPLRGSQSIVWNIRFRNGTRKRFEFRNRTTPQGSAEPYRNKPSAQISEIADDAVLFTKATHSCDMDQFIQNP